MSEFNHQNAENAAQAEIKYPIVLHQNTSINAKPPYKLLRYSNGDFMQLIDMRCQRFSDPAVSGAAYAIALFSIKPEESALIESKPDRLDFLAAMLYAHVPADRFVRASVVKDGRPVDIKVQPGCASIDKEVQEDTVVFEEAVAVPESSGKTVKKQDPGCVNLVIKPDVLTDEQRDFFVFAPIRSARRLNEDDIQALSLTELMSLVFVYSKCDVSRFPQPNVDVKNDNFNFLLNAAAKWMRDNTFYTVHDLLNDELLKLSNNGTPFALVFSERAMAETVIGGNENLECREVGGDKAAFFGMLVDAAVPQFIADANPTTLSTRGYMNYMANN